MAELSEAKELSVRILRSLLWYVRDELEPSALEQVYSRAGVSPESIKKNGGWVSHETFERLIAAARSTMDSDTTFAQACVYELRRGYGAPLMALSFLSGEQVFKTLARTVSAVSKISRYMVNLPSSREIVLTYFTQRAESRLMCLTRRTQLPMVPTFVGLPRADLQEESCVAWGDPCCKYRLRLRSYARWRTVLIGIGIGFGCALLTPASTVAPALSVWMFPALGFAAGAAIELRRRFVAQHRFLSETRAELHDKDTLEEVPSGAGIPPSRTSETTAIRPGTGTVDRDAPTRSNEGKSGARSQTRPQASTIREGARIGRYEVISRAGSGGMGTVFAARDTKLDRRVALKLLHANHQPETRRVAKLIREAQSLAALSHPNVVTVFDVGEWTETVFLAMEFIEGRTLKQWATDHPHATTREALHPLLQAAEGLAAAHDAGLIHRDFKPSNVMVGNDDRTRVTDFGLARKAGVRNALGRKTETHQEGHEHPQEFSDSGSHLETTDVPATATGTVAGTPRYMAPEQHEGRRLDPRCDQFSFSVVAYELLCGVHPFGTCAEADLYAACKAASYTPPVRDVSPPLLAVLVRGMAPSRRKRFGSMRELARQLSEAAEFNGARPDGARPRILERLWPRR